MGHRSKPVPQRGMRATSIRGHTQRRCCSHGFPSVGRRPRSALRGGHRLPASIHPIRTVSDSHPQGLGARLSHDTARSGCEGAVALLAAKARRGGSCGGVTSSRTRPALWASAAGGTGWGNRCRAATRGPGVGLWHGPLTSCGGAAPVVPTGATRVASRSEKAEAGRPGGPWVAARYRVGRPVPPRSRSSPPTVCSQAPRGPLRGVSRRIARGRLRPRLAGAG